VGLGKINLSSNKNYFVEASIYLLSCANQNGSLQKPEERNWEAPRIQ
jgi:hypothetical protein